MSIKTEAAELGLHGLRRFGLRSGQEAWVTFDGDSRLFLSRDVDGQISVHVKVGSSEVRGTGKTLRKAIKQAAWLTEGGNLLAVERIRLHARLVEISQRGTQGSLL